MSKSFITLPSTMKVFRKKKAIEIDPERLATFIGEIEVILEKRGIPEWDWDAVIERHMPYIKKKFSKGHNPHDTGELIVIKEY